MPLVRTSSHVRGKVPSLIAVPVGDDPRDLHVVDCINPRRPARARPTRSSAVAKTMTHTRKTLMLMRSHSPIHGVGRSAWSRGASEKVNAPNATRTTMLAMETAGNVSRMPRRYTHGGEHQE